MRFELTTIVDHYNLAEEAPSWLVRSQLLPYAGHGVENEILLVI